MAASAGFVLVMADFESDGVWGPGGRWMAASDLPVSPGLRARLAAWSRRYEGGEAEAGGGPLDLEAFAAEGMELAREVKSELPDWDVVYHDEAALRSAPEGAPRDEWQLEVALGPAPGRGA